MLRLAETTAAAAYRTQPQWTHGTAIRHAARAVREVRLPSEAGETDRWPAAALASALSSADDQG
ncbi:hypothetical protein HBI56_035570 [Parastagonospora nodorum]|nr:hypothetical protein HBH56_071240 [Parastagonospora nodorum]KAH3932326.1 hypothetical protein HBH54_076870 [Parastagonospora nodorum]KAH3954953.1 hypothetical protein HBH53_017480 [Parastagonospora nodorum]KAH3986267.1 hypothetical protein HBH52_048630 [Parastagonospora nodorum]KAH4004634.1 hypothetical protein HBI10_038940 [Parastagonospora nodorum]